MKRILKSLLAALLLVNTLNGCKEQELLKYDEDKEGSSIYFSQAYSTNVDSVHIKFGFLPVDMESTVLNIQVAATGPLHAEDRKFRLVIDSQSTMLEGTHFRFTQEDLIIPANKRTGTVQLELFKTADMQTKILDAAFELLPNVNFNTDIPYRWSANNLKAFPILKYRVKVDNILEKPYVWSVAPYKSSFEGYFGEYSQAKLNLIIKLFDEKLEHFTDPVYAKDKYFTTNKWVYWSSYMKYWLGKEASEGRIHLDENEKEITLGPYAD